MKKYLAAGLLVSTQILATLPLAGQGTMGAAPASAPVPASSESLGATIFWVGTVVFACVAAAGGVILARKLHRQKALIAAGLAPAPAPASRRLFSIPTNGNGNNNGNGSKSVKHNHRNSKPAKDRHTNGHNANARRRRMFNYHKFYTEMVLQGPSPSSVTDGNYAAYNPYGGYYVEYEPPRVNSNGNGHVNGNGGSNGQDHHGSESSAEINGTRAAHTDLLATQRALIEEQQRLIQEQARLIEEKSRLIAEKNQLLERQSQMIDNSLL